MSFAFSFSGDDIDEEEQADVQAQLKKAQTSAPSNSAFPVAGKPLLPATRHDLKHMLSQLPSKIAYGTLEVELDSSSTIRLPRRELWDVRVQLMAEEPDGADTEAGLGSHDVKTGVYEGGFKSWESSVDLVKVLDQSKLFLTSKDEVPCVIELGCGTALPSLAIFQWATTVPGGSDHRPLSIILADYNATVLQLVTLPNFILSWALQQAGTTPHVARALASEEGELELTPEVIQSFTAFLSERKISLDFISGGWSPDFVELVKDAQQASSPGEVKQRMVILGAETIYSPFALQSFTDTIFSLMRHQQSAGNNAETFAAAKKLYFGVGGSLDDFVVKAKELGAEVMQLREETEGVRRGVVKCHLGP